jgi:hypothetical protein
MTSRQDRFFSYVREKLVRIDGITDEDLLVHKKVLYVTFLDSISALIYPAYSQNRARFTEFVLRFGKWEEAERVSTPHLARALSLNPDPAYDKVRALVHSTLDSWRQGAHIDLTSDLEAGVVGTHWPSGKLHEQPVEGAAWTHLKHVELLYAFRNSLVHDFRALGPPYDMPEDESPYYISTHTSPTDSTESEFHWELVYPIDFLRRLASTALDSAEAHVRRNHIDPVEVLRTGRYWLRALNK